MLPSRRPAAPPYPMCGLRAHCLCQRLPTSSHIAQIFCRYQWHGLPNSPLIKVVRFFVDVGGNAMIKRKASPLTFSFELKIFLVSFRSFLRAPVSQPLSIADGICVLRRWDSCCSILSRFHFCNPRAIIWTTLRMFAPHHPPCAPPGHAFPPRCIRRPGLVGPPRCICR